MFRPLEDIGEAKRQAAAEEKAALDEIFRITALRLDQRAIEPAGR